MLNEHATVYAAQVNNSFLVSVFLFPRKPSRFFGLAGVRRSWCVASTVYVSKKVLCEFQPLFVAFVGWAFELVDETNEDV